jgi:hypothetical protein
MGLEYGYLQGFARKIGDFKICTVCDGELRRRGFLRLHDNEVVLPDGSLKRSQIFIGNKP